jgi:hypothetical protein
VVVTGDAPRQEKDALLAPLRALGPLSDTVGSCSWADNQRTHSPGILAVKKECPVHYEEWSGGHIMLDQVGRGGDGVCECM